VKRGNTWAHATHAPRITPSLQRKLDWLETRLRECGLRTPLLSELGEDAGREGIDEHELIRLLNFLAGKGSVYRIDGNYLHASIVDRARKQYGDALRIRPGGMTVAEFRDLIGGNRKICLLMLQQFDEEGVSVRRGDRRFSA